MSFHNPSAKFKGSLTIGSMRKSVPLERVPWLYGMRNARHRSQRRMRERLVTGHPFTMLASCRRTEASRTRRSSLHPPSTKMCDLNGSRRTLGRLIVFFLRTTYPTEYGLSFRSQAHAGDESRATRTSLSQLLQAHLRCMRLLHPCGSDTTQYFEYFIA